MSRARLRRFFRHGLLPQLIVFEAVARLGSVTRAAEALHLAQPTVSMQIKKLSATLEVALFEQRGRQLHLTAAGHALLESCAEMMTMLGRMEERLAPWRQPGSEVLRLAAEPEARQIASRLVAAFSARHPGVQVSLHLAARAELISRFAASQDDVYLFELEIDGLAAGERWSVAHVKGRKLAAAAALFLRDALRLDAMGAPANNAPASPGDAGEPKRRA